jgi:hypothetical protein
VRTLGPSRISDEFDVGPRLQVANQAAKLARQILVDEEDA